MLFSVRPKHVPLENMRLWQRCKNQYIYISLLFTHQGNLDLTFSIEPTALKCETLRCILEGNETLHCVLQQSTQERQLSCYFLVENISSGSETPKPMTRSTTNRELLGSNTFPSVFGVGHSITQDLQTSSHYPYLLLYLCS